MKKLFVMAICIFLSAVSVSAQEDADLKYSIGSKLFSYTQMPKNMNQTNSQDYQKNIARTVFVKINDNQLSFRLTGTYISDDTGFSNQCNGCQQGIGKLVDYSFKAGFEKNFNYSTIQPYIGFDLGYRSHNFSGFINVLQGPTPDYNVESTKTGATITPLLGLKINVLPALTLFAEGNLELYYAYERRETVDQVAGSPTVFNRFTRMEYLLNPVSLGLQINFGR